MRQTDEKINTLKNEKLATFVRPCSVFMTFENEEGLERALNFDYTTKDENQP